MTLVNVAVLPPVASCVTININDLPFVAVGMVNVQLPFSVTDWNVPFARDNVCVVPELPIETGVSVKLVIDGLTIVVAFSVVTFAVAVLTSEVALSVVTFTVAVLTKLEAFKVVTLMVATLLRPVDVINPTCEPLIENATCAVVGK